MHRARPPQALEQRIKGDIASNPVMVSGKSRFQGGRTPRLLLFCASTFCMRGGAVAEHRILLPVPPRPPYTYAYTYNNDNINNENKQVYSKSYCPYCTRVKALFGDMGVKIVVAELDQLRASSPPPSFSELG